jgi:glycosyltransferase involved in cell wall biosynthesis
MPHILLDISRLFYRRLHGWLPTGIDRVSLEYVRHYAGRARAVLGAHPFYSVLSEQESARGFEFLLGPPAGDRMAMAAMVARAYFRWWTRPGLADCILLNTTHTALEHARYAASLRRRGARPVFLIHDLIPITHPEYCRQGERERHTRRIRNAVSAGRGIIVPSRHTLQTLRQFCADTALPAPAAVVAPLASSLPRGDATERPLPQPYFVVLGTIEMRKNLELLLDVWTQLAAQLGASAPRLVIIGQRGLGHERIAARTESAALRGLVIELGACSDRAVSAWLRHSQALLFPSFEEGYGLPLAEALALGVPAITSDLPSFREIAGEIPEYAGCRDTARWGRLIAGYADPASEARAGQLRRIAGFRRTTWAGHFEAVDAFLHELQYEVQGTRSKLQGTA